MTRYLLLGLLALSLSGAACPGAQTKDTSPPTEAKVGPPAPWHDLSFEDKKAYMVKTVLPTMKHLFQAYDKDLFDDFSCATCHGDTAKERNFEMPNPDLIALYPTGSQQQKDLVAKYKDDDHSMLVFMFSKVVPTMTEILGEEPYNATTKTGFTCFECHTHGE